jgi:hypothetical protein
VGPFTATLLAVVAIGGWAAARIALANDQGDPLARTVTGLMLAVGGLTQVMMWIALAAPGHLGPGTTVVALTAVLAVAGVRWRHRLRRSWREVPRETRATRWPLPAATIAVVIGCAAILTGAVLWPFGPDDALAVYGPLGRQIAVAGALPVGEGLYEAYPLLVPMLFAAIEWLTGGPNEYLSRLVVAVLAVGGIAGAGWLARELRSSRAGWLAAALLTSSGVYCRWAVTGYADVPAGFFLVVAAVFGWRWWRHRVPAEAVLGGVAAGLAMWTKNSTLTLVVTGPVLAAGWWWASRDQRLRPRRDRRAPSPGRSWRWAHVAAAAAVTAAVAGPFYLRNLIVFGHVVPPTVWSDRAHRDLAGLLDPLRPSRGFGLVGWLAMAAVLIGLGRIATRRGAAPEAVLVTSLVLPFVGSWWWYASYDPRFLVTLLPVVAGVSGALLDRVMARIEASRWRHAPRLRAAILVGVLLGTPPALRRAIEHKWALLDEPLMIDVDRHRLQVGGLFELGRAIDRLPPESRIAGVPPLARYYLGPERLPNIRWAGADVRPCAQDTDYQVFAAQPRNRLDDATCQGTVVLQTRDGYELVEIAPEDES